MTITAIIVVLLILGAISLALEKESVGNTVNENEYKVQKIRHKLKVLRIWFWITFALGTLLFVLSLIANIREPEQDYNMVGVMIAVFVFFYAIPLFLLICIFRQKKQLRKVQLFLDDSKKVEEQAKTFTQSVKNDNDTSNTTSNNTRNATTNTNAAPKYKPLSQVIDELLYCKRDGGVVFCHANEYAFEQSLYGNSPWDIKQWYYDTFDYVNKGDNLFMVSSYYAKRPFPDQILKSPVSGFLFRQERPHYQSWKPNELVCVFHDNMNLLIDRLSANVIEIVKDDFSEDVIVRGKKIACSPKGCPLGDIQINFENRMGEYSLLVRFSRKTMYVRKNDTLNILFEDGSIIKLTALSAPIKCTDNYDEYVIRYGIKSEHIKMFKELAMSKWQIKSGDGEVLGTGDIHHRDKGIGLVFKDFIVKFENEVRRNISEADLQKYEQAADSGKQGNSSESCYVYLMKDLANNYYKIGISNRPEYREKTLQSEKPTIEMICRKKFPSRKIARAVESALHKAYSEQHVRGEWFNLKKEDVNEIIKTLS